MITLKIKNITIQHANCLPSLNIVGFPAITSFVGFANAIAYKYGRNNASIAIVTTGCDVEYGMFKFGKYNTNKVRGNNTYINDKSKKEISLSDQPNVFGRVELSLYINFEDDTISKEINNDINSGKLKHELLTKFRIAGGVFEKIESVSLLYDENELNEDILKNKTSYIISDKSYMIEDAVSENENQISVALNKIYENEVKNKANKNSDLILSLSSVGYILLEEPYQKIGSRNDKKHAYAETLIGLIGFKKINSIDDIKTWEIIKHKNMFIAVN